MNALIKPGTIIIINYLCSSTFLILTVQASKRRSCLDKDPPSEEIFFEDHYNEVGFARDVCVELGRKLHAILHLPKETKPCARLAGTRTSTCYPCQPCHKWNRQNKKNAKANSDVMTKALKMVQDFITVVAVDKKLPIIDIPVQSSIFECIETAVDLLKKSGLTLYSQSDEQKLKLISEIENLKPAFCDAYLKELVREAEKRQAAYLAELNKNELLSGAEENSEATQQTDAEDDGQMIPSTKNELRGSIGAELEGQESEILEASQRGQDGKIPMGSRGMEVELGEDESKIVKTVQGIVAKLGGQENKILEASPVTEPRMKNEYDWRGTQMNPEDHGGKCPPPTDYEDKQMTERVHREVQVQDARGPESKEVTAFQQKRDFFINLAKNEIKKQIAKPSNKEKPKKPKEEINANMKTSDATGEKKEEFPLHESVFRNNYRRMYGLLNDRYDVTKKDKHGNTALHLAVMLGRHRFVGALLYYGAPVKSRNSLGWSSLDEAISYGDEETVKMLLRKIPVQTQDDLIKKRQNLLKDLPTVPDFYMELKWEFRHYKLSPLNMILPADLCKIRKRHKSIRIDWSLVGMNDNMTYKYRNAALLFDGLTSPSPIVYFLSVNKKKFMKIDIEEKPEMSDYEAGDTAKKMMKEDIIYATMSTRNVAYKRLTNWRGSWKTETIGPFTADIYFVNGLALKFKQRAEHRLKREEMKKQAEEEQRKAEEEQRKVEEEKRRAEEEKTKAEPKRKKEANKKTGKSKDEEKKEDDKAQVEKNPYFEKQKEEGEKPLPPPPATDVTWEDYIKAEPGEYSSLAREIVETEKLVSVKESNIGIVPKFPITKDAFVRILEVVAPFKQFNKLREFVEAKLPEGFPVKLDIPIMMGLSAKITILKVESSETIAKEEILDEGLFVLPADYTDMDEEDKKDMKQ